MITRNKLMARIRELKHFDPPIFDWNILWWPETYETNHFSAPSCRRVQLQTQRARSLHTQLLESSKNLTHFYSAYYAVMVYRNPTRASNTLLHNLTVRRAHYYNYARYTAIQCNSPQCRRFVFVKRHFETRLLLTPYYEFFVSPLDVYCAYRRCMRICRICRTWQSCRF